MHLICNKVIMTKWNYILKDRISKMMHLCNSTFIEIVANAYIVELIRLISTSWLTYRQSHLALGFYQLKIDHQSKNINPNSQFYKIALLEKSNKIMHFFSFETSLVYLGTSPDTIGKSADLLKRPFWRINWKLERVCDTNATYNIVAWWWLVPLTPAFVPDWQVFKQHDYDNNSCGILDIYLHGINNFWKALLSLKCQLPCQDAPCPVNEVWSWGLWGQGVIPTTSISMV